MTHILKGYNQVTEEVEGVCVVRNRIVVLDSLAGEVYEGNLFTHTAKQTVASLGELIHLIRTDSDDNRLESFEFGATASPNDVFFYEAPFVDVNSLGTEHEFINRNRLSTNVIGSQIYQGSFIDTNSLGTQLEYNLNPEVSGGNNKELGGNSQGLHEWILKKNTDYLIRFINQDPSNAATVAVSITIVDE